ncbi:disks large homolog 4-like [Arapaima gigas]
MEMCLQGTMGDEQFRVRASKLLHIFRSDLFQALLDIQEHYELSMLEACTVGHPHAPLLKYLDCWRQPEEAGAGNQLLVLQTRDSRSLTVSACGMSCRPPAGGGLQGGWRHHMNRDILLTEELTSV